MARREDNRTTRVPSVLWHINRFTVMGWQNGINIWCSREAIKNQGKYWTVCKIYSASLFDKCILGRRVNWRNEIRLNWTFHYPTIDCCNSKMFNFNLTVSKAYQFYSALQARAISFQVVQINFLIKLNIWMWFWCVKSRLWQSLKQTVCFVVTHSPLVVLVNPWIFVCVRFVAFNLRVE